MKVAFLDFEFGQIYGSWRRDFLITEAAVLVYDIDSDSIKIGEKIFAPVCNLIMRKRIKDKERNKTISTHEYLLQVPGKKKVKFNPSYKMPKSQRKHYRILWSKRYANTLRTFLYSATADVDSVFVFGGREDIELLKRYCIAINAPIVDIQKILQKTYAKLYSLDYIAHRLHLSSSDRGYIRSINYRYKFPKHQKKIFRYDQSHLKAHNASGDCALLFLAYMELF
jgi:hypothetical protein